MTRAVICLVLVACATPGEPAPTEPPCSCWLMHTCLECAAAPARVVCRNHADCSSAACLPEGTCAPSATVAYASPGHDGDCSRTWPCQISTALDTGRPIIKMSGVFRESVNITAARTVTLLADPMTRVAPTAGSHFAIRVGESSWASIWDLGIGESAMVGDVGVLVPDNTPAPRVELHRVTLWGNLGPAVSVGSGTLVLTDSLIAFNPGGGVVVAGAATHFEIRNNAFEANGTARGSVGGVRLETELAAGDALTFNTFYANATDDGIGGGIHCTVAGFTARNNLVSTNGSLTNALQVSGACEHAYTLVHTITPIPPPPGVGNISADPLFLDAPHQDLRVGANSPAVGGADPEASARDRDGVPRNTPATIGAYEYRAP